MFSILRRAFLVKLLILLFVFHGVDAVWKDWFRKPVTTARARLSSRLHADQALTAPPSQDASAAFEPPSDFSHHSESPVAGDNTNEPLERAVSPDEQRKRDAIKLFRQLPEPARFNIVLRSRRLPRTIEKALDHANETVLRFEQARACAFREQFELVYNVTKVNAIQQWQEQVLPHRTRVDAYIEELRTQYASIKSDMLSCAEQAMQAEHEAAAAKVLLESAIKHFKRQLDEQPGLQPSMKASMKLDPLRYLRDFLRAFHWQRAEGPQGPWEVEAAQKDTARAIALARREGYPFFDITRSSELELRTEAFWQLRACQERLRAVLRQMHPHANENTVWPRVDMDGVRIQPGLGPVPHAVEPQSQQRLHAMGYAERCPTWLLLNHYHQPVTTPCGQGKDAELPSAAVQAVLNGRV